MPFPSQDMESFCKLHMAIHLRPNQEALTIPLAVHLLHLTTALSLTSLTNLHNEQQVIWIDLVVLHGVIIAKACGIAPRKVA